MSQWWWFVLLTVVAAASGVLWWHRCRRDHQALLHALPQPVVISDGQGRIAMSNAAFLALCAQTGAQCQGADRRLESMVNAWCAHGFLPRSEMQNALDAFVPAAAQKRLRVGDKYFSVTSVRLPSGLIASTLNDVSELIRAQTALSESESAKRTLFDTAPVGIVVTARASGAILQANERAASQLGVPSASALVGQNMSSLYARPQERQQVIAAIDLHGSIDDQEIELRDMNGNSVWVQFSARAVVEGGQPAIYTAAVNISRSKQIEQNLRASEHRLRELLELAPNAIFIFSVDGGNVLFLNRLASQLAGPNPDRWADMQVSERVGEDAQISLLAALRKGGQLKDRELQLQTGQGDLRWFHVSSTLIEYAGQSALFCAMLDIDPRKQAEAQLRQARRETEAVNRELRVVNVELDQLASTDRLTHAFNRRHFEEVALREMSRSRRYSLPLALIMLDLDFFKAINDDFGHAAGDLVLVEFVKMTRAHLRSSDVLARWGGEEFVVLAPSTSLEEAVVLAEKLRQLLEKHSFEELRPLTVSAGVTCLGFRDTLDSFLRRADKALYQSKSGGRNRVTGLSTDAQA